MLKFSGICIALLGLALAIDGQMGIRDARCDNLLDGTGNVMANGKACREFLVCWNYYIYGPFPCLGNTLFNSTSGNCDATQCFDDRKGPVDGCVFTGSLPEDCSRFSVCIIGIEWQSQCGEGTYYSNTLLICVLPTQYPEIPEIQGCFYSP